MPHLARACFTALLLLLATSVGATLTLTKSYTESDVTGTPGRLCMDDKVTITIRAEVTDTAETFTITDSIEADWYSFWLEVSSAGTKCSTGEGFTLPGGTDGIFCAADFSLSPGESFDFVYRATVRDNSADPLCCGVAQGNTGVVIVDSNDPCVEYTCDCRAAVLPSTGGLKAAKDDSFAGIDLSWDVAPLAPQYHVNMMLDKVELLDPRRDVGSGRPVCRAFEPDISCPDDDALGDPETRLFYQVLAACGPDGVHEGPF